MKAASESNASTRTVAPTGREHGVQHGAEEVDLLEHHAFSREGIDGSLVVAHFPPVDPYNAEILGEELSHAVRNYAEKGRGTRSLPPFGFDEGSGGTTRDMVERARRLKTRTGAGRVQRRTA